MDPAILRTLNWWTEPTNKQTATNKNNNNRIEGQEFDDRINFISNTSRTSNYSGNPEIDWAKKASNKYLFKSGIECVIFFIIMAI